ncbi:hypothetical protein D3C78_1433510 [compost metagenome]
MHFGIDPTFAHHHFHGVAGNHANQCECQQGDAEERGDQQPQSAGNKTKHLLVYLISRFGVPGSVESNVAGCFLIYFTRVVAKLLVVRGLM